LDAHSNPPQHICVGLPGLFFFFPGHRLRNQTCEKRNQNNAENFRLSHHFHTTAFKTDGTAWVTEGPWRRGNSNKCTCTKRSAPHHRVMEIVSHHCAGAPRLWRGLPSRPPHTQTCWLTAAAPDQPTNRVPHCVSVLTPPPHQAPRAHSALFSDPALRLAPRFLTWTLRLQCPAPALSFLFVSRSLVQTAATAVCAFEKFGFLEKKVESRNRLSKFEIRNSW